MFLEVKEIKFAEFKEGSIAKNYPDSGFFITEIEEGGTDLRFVDKSSGLSICICPKSVFDGLQFMAVNPDHHKEPEVLTTLETAPPTGYASETFILDFTKILLSQKK